MPVKLVEVKLFIILEGFLGVGFHFMLGSKIGATCQGDWWKVINFPLKLSCSPFYFGFAAEMWLGED